MPPMELGIVLISIPDLINPPFYYPTLYTSYVKVNCYLSPEMHVNNN